MDETKVFSVSELNGLVKELFDRTSLFLNIAVCGELSNYKIYPSGHHYFTLKDSESSLRCVMFKSSAARLRFRPENGMSVTVFGRVSVYPRDGAYQLYCSGIMPEGVGDLQVAFEQLKQKLSADGLFDDLADVPASVWLDQESRMIVQIDAELGELLSLLAERSLAESRSASSFDTLGLEMSLERAHLSLRLRDFNEAEDFQIPDEARSAWGSDVMPWDT